MYTIKKYCYLELPIVCLFIMFLFSNFVFLLVQIRLQNLIQLKSEWNLNFNWLRVFWQFILTIHVEMISINACFDGFHRQNIRFNSMPSGEFRCRFRSKTNFSPKWNSFWVLKAIRKPFVIVKVNPLTRNVTRSRHIHQTSREFSIRAAPRNLYVTSKKEGVAFLFA